VETISELRTKAAELRKVADTLDAAAAALTRLGATSNGLNAGPPTAFQHLSETVRDLKQMSGLDAIYEVLAATPRPLNKDEISERLSARGKAIGDATLQSYLSRDDRFVSLGRGQWTTALQVAAREKLL